jgi:hypothetical protein
MIRIVVLSAALLEANAQCNSENMGMQCKRMCGDNAQEWGLPGLGDERRLQSAAAAVPEHIDGNVCCSNDDGQVRSEVFSTMEFERSPVATDEFQNCADDTSDIMADCQAFCDEAPGIAVPLLIGGEKWGVDLGSALQICMSPELLGGSAGYTEEMQKDYDCFAKHDYLDKILREVVAFSKTVRLFQYEALKFRATIARKAKEIKVELAKEETYREFDLADKKDKPGLITEKYKEQLAVVTASEATLQKKAAVMQKNINTLKTVVEENIELFLTFMDKCNMFYPKSGVFMKDICRVTHGVCIDEPDASHVACCCLVNPIGKIVRPEGALEVVSSDDGESSDEGPVDISASILQDSETEVDEIRNDIHELGEDAVVDEFEGELKAKYGKAYNRPCFPSTATVLGHDGATRPIHSLKEGDSILAADAHGNLIYDTVSVFSLRDNTTDAAFVSLDVGGRLALTLTPGHHLPTGKECCSQLTQAKDVRVGDMVWVAAEDPHHSESRSLEARVIKAIGKTTGTGLHNPLLTHGSHPVIDGVVTAFNKMHVVTFNSYVVPVVSQICKWLGTCDATRRVVAAVECAYKHSTHALKHRALSEASLCTALHYIDGTAIHAGSYI